MDSSNQDFEASTTSATNPLTKLTMRFKIPGRDIQVRIVERVMTNDPQYDIYDVGIEYEDGSIDSLVVPGSGSYKSAKAFVKRIDDKAQMKESTATA